MYDAVAAAVWAAGKPTDAVLASHRGLAPRSTS